MANEKTSWAFQDERYLFIFFHAGYNARILQEFSHEVLVMLTYSYNAVQRFRYVPEPWKQAKIFMIQKPDKATKEPSSF